MKHFFKTADIEDMAKARIVPRLVGANKLNFAQGPAKIKAEEKEELKMENCPTPDEDFGKWLTFQKSSWRKIRKDLKSEKKVIG